MSGPLSHIRILDLSRILAGPFCTQVLGDLGADVIKVEKPGAGDDTRQWGPPYLKDAAGNDTSESAYYLSANRNKRSVAIDITTQEGQTLIDAMLGQCDVMIENFKVGALDKYGLGYDAVHKRHPRLVYCSITGFGQTGPLKDDPGYDFLAQAMGGLMAITGERAGEPMKAGVALSDVMTGLYAAIGILAGLQHRDRTGEGQRVDLSLLDTTVSSMVNIAQYYLTSGTPAPRLGNAHSTIVPYQVFATEDGYVILAVGNDVQFQRLCNAIGERWCDDARFTANRDRVRNRDALIALMDPVLKGHTTQWWVEAMSKANVPAGPVNTMDQVFAMEQIKVRGMEIEMPHTLAPAPVHLVGSPLKLSETPVTYRHAPPTAGEHSEAILKELLDLPQAALDDLKAKGIIA